MPVSPKNKEYCPSGFTDYVQPGQYRLAAWAVYSVAFRSQTVFIGATNKDQCIPTLNPAIAGDRPGVVEST